MKGLIIDTPHIDNILSGRKSWEMRSSLTRQRGTIALIRKGSGQVVGVADLVNSIGPLDPSELLSNQTRHLMTPDRIEAKGSKYRFAWVLEKVRKLSNPIDYKHPSGAVIWVQLDESVAPAVRQA